MVLGAQQGNREAFSRLIDPIRPETALFCPSHPGRKRRRARRGPVRVAPRASKTGEAQVARRISSLVVPHRPRPGRNELRRKSTRAVFANDADTSQVEDDENVDSSAFDNAELVHVALRDLSVDHRRVLTLRFLEDMSIDEIAEVIGQGSGTVKSRLHYAKLALRRRIEELTDE